MKDSTSALDDTSFNRIQMTELTDRTEKTLSPLKSDGNWTVK